MFLLLQIRWKALIWSFFFFWLFLFFFFLKNHTTEVGISDSEIHLRPAQTALNLITSDPLCFSDLSWPSPSSVHPDWPALIVQSFSLGAELLSDSLSWILCGFPLALSCLAQEACLRTAHCPSDSSVGWDGLSQPLPSSLGLGLRQRDLNI